MKLLFLLVGLVALMPSVFGQSKTWGGAGKTLYPNAAPVTIVTSQFVEVSIDGVIVKLAIVQ